MKRLRMLSGLMSVALLATTAQANLLDDGDFEAATTQTQTSNSNWVLTTNTPDTTNASAQFRSENWSSYPPGAPPGMGVWFQAFEGNQNAGVDPLAQADVTQTLNAPVGGEYSLSFWAKRETNFSAGSWSVSLSSAGTGGTDEVDLLSGAPADGSWNQFTLSLSGVTAGDALTVSGAMVDGMDAGANPQSAFLDTFDLEAIPEPTSIALIGIGLLGLLGAGRRR